MGTTQTEESKLSDVAGHTILLVPCGYQNHTHANNYGMHFTVPNFPTLQSRTVKVYVIPLLSIIYFSLSTTGDPSLHHFTCGVGLPTTSTINLTDVPDNTSAS